MRMQHPNYKIPFAHQGGKASMNIVTIETLKSNADKLISDVLTNDEFFKVSTPNGNAVVINEREWEILIESLRCNIGVTKS